MLAVAVGWCPQPGSEPQGFSYMRPVHVSFACVVPRGDQHPPATVQASLLRALGGCAVKGVLIKASLTGRHFHSLE